jgi:hypothetical protein
MSVYDQWYEKLGAGWTYRGLAWEYVIGAATTFFTGTTTFFKTAAG